MAESYIYGSTYQKIHSLTQDPPILILQPPRMQPLRFTEVLHCLRLEKLSFFQPVQRTALADCGSDSSVKQGHNQYSGQTMEYIPFGRPMAVIVWLALPNATVIFFLPTTALAA